MSRMTKAERHAARKAVRRMMQITGLEIMEMHPELARVTLAEMRKRGFIRDFMRELWKYPGRRVPLYHAGNNWGIPMKELAL